MKRNKIFTFGLIAAFVAILSLTLVSGTYAKYTSTVSGEDSATVAKWGFEVNSEALNLGSEELTFNLFDTILDTKDNLDEADVANGKIAPGTKGSFAFSIKNASEVTAQYELFLEVTNENNIPLVFKVDSGKVTPGATALKTGTLAIKAKATTITVEWEWPFEATSPNTDEADTVLGIGGTATITVTAKLVFTQID